MLGRLILAAFGAAITLAPLTALAEMKASPVVPSMTLAQTTRHSYHRPTTGSHRSEMRARSNLSRDRARAGAEHARQARQHHY